MMSVYEIWYFFFRPLSVLSGFSRLTGFEAFEDFLIDIKVYYAHEVGL